MISEDLFELGFNENTRVAVISLLLDLLAELPAERLSELLIESQAAANGESGAESNHLPAWEARATLLSHAQSLRGNE